MQSFLTSRKVMAAGAGLAMFGGIVGAGVLGGQVSGASAAGVSSLSAFVQQTNPAPQKGDRQAEMDAYLQKLAANLNISADTLNAALKKTALDQLAADVASGKITQAQADQEKTEIENGTAPLFGPGGPGRGGHGQDGGPGGIGGPQDAAALAQFLGMDQATFETAEHSGQSLAAIATAHGKSRDDLKAFLVSQETARLKDAVTKGRLTQAQADQMLQQFQANLDARIDDTHAGGPMGGPGGHNRGRGAPSQQTAPSGS